MLTESLVQLRDKITAHLVIDHPVRVHFPGGILAITNMCCIAQYVVRQQQFEQGVISIDIGLPDFTDVVFAGIQALESSLLEQFNSLPGVVLHTAVTGPCPGEGALLVETLDGRFSRGRIVDLQAGFERLPVHGGVEQCWHSLEKRLLQGRKSVVGKVAGRPVAVVCEVLLGLHSLDDRLFHTGSRYGLSLSLSGWRRTETTQEIAVILGRRLCREQQ